MVSNCVNYDAYFDRQVAPASTMLSVGIAMIQGARHEHGQAVQQAAKELGLEIEIIYLREQDDVSNELDCIILPGGESTTMRLVSTNHNVLPAIFDWIKENPGKKVLGTCAGAILLSNPGDGIEPFIQTGISRNAWGRQRMSFEAEIDVDLHVKEPDLESKPLSQLPLDKDDHRPLVVRTGDHDGFEGSFNGVFIRAPRFDSESCTDQVIAKLGEEVVGVKSGNILALTFHPELTGDAFFHRWLLQNES